MGQRQGQGEGQRDKDKDNEVGKGIRGNRVWTMV